MTEAAASVEPLKREQVIARIEEGLEQGIPLRELCREPGMPARRTFDDWRQADPELSARIARARQVGFDHLAEETLEIADDGTNDWIERQNQRGQTYIALNEEAIARSKVRIDTRLKLLAKWDVTRYGERQRVDHAGEIATSTTDPNELVARLVTMGTQYPTLNPVIRKMAQSILEQLPEIKS